MTSLEGPVIDAIEAPEYYYSHADFEDAGDGNIRIIRYVKRRGILIPTVSTVASAESLLKLGQEVMKFAAEMLMGGARRH